MPTTAPQVDEIHLLQKSRLLQVRFSDGNFFELPCEYLRVFSPSAEVRGHSGQGGQLVSGKRQVNITAIEPVGHYAVKLIFDDGHDTGLYSWETLYELGENYRNNWQTYLADLAAAGKSRD